MSYAEKCKFYNGHTQRSLSFMSEGFIILCGIDSNSCYQHAFAYIRQLAIHLRTCVCVVIMLCHVQLTNKNKESYSKIANWQFINCLRLWCSVASIYNAKSLLGPLVYPLLEIVIGTIRLFPSPSLYPMRFILIRCVIQVATAAHVYVPAVIHCMEVVDLINIVI